MDWRLIGRNDELQTLVDKIKTNQSVLLTGAAGVGKSRLAEEAKALLDTSHHIERVIGSPSLAGVSFGAVAHLAGDAPLPEPSALISFVTRAMRRRAARRPIAVIADDVNQLDDGSLAFIQSLLTHEPIPVLATVRTEGAADRRVVPLWKDGLMERSELRPLSRPDADELAQTITGGPCGATLLNELWRLTDGHPLFIRELLLEGLDQETVTNEQGLWTLKGRLGTSQRVADIVAARTDHLDGAERSALEAVALSEPIPLGLANRAADTATLERLEARRMIRVESTPDGPLLRTSHPLIAEVTVARMPHLARTRATARLARILLDSPSLSFQDSMRASTWLLDAGEVPPQPAAIDGARAALRAFDHVLAGRLAEAALTGGKSQTALVLRGRAHAAGGDLEAATTTLHGAQSAAGDDAELAAATTALAEVQMFILGDFERAILELDKSLETMSEPGPRAEVSSHMMMAAGMAGDFDLGLSVGPEVADRADLPGPSQLNSLMAMTLTQTMTGKLSGVQDRLHRSEQLADLFSDYQPFAPDQVGMNRLLAHHALGEFAAADFFANESLQAGVGIPGGWLFVSAMSRLFTGDINDGLQRVAEAETQLESIDPLGLLPMAWGLRALLHAMAGNQVRANERIEMADADPRGAQTRVSVWTNRARAWTAANSGDPTHAAALAEHAGRLAATGTHYVWAAFAYHDAVRFGGADIVGAPLADLAAEDRGPLVQLLADHATAAADRDLTLLRDVIERATAIGAEALAAEAHAAAAMVAPGVDRVRHAHLAGQYHRRCIGLRSPLLDGVPSSLTKRQEQIAALAARGHPSRDIAAQLHLSARTIDNHLRTVYRIFEIDGRKQLPELFPR